MSYPLSHTVVTKKKKKKRKEKKNNRNKLSRSVANGKQYKHQNILSIIHDCSFSWFGTSNLIKNKKINWRSEIKTLQPYLPLVVKY